MSKLACNFCRVNSRSGPPPPEVRLFFPRGGLWGKGGFSYVDLCGPCHETLVSEWASSRGAVMDAWGWPEGLEIFCWMPVGKYRRAGHYTLHPYLVFSEDTNAQGEQFCDNSVPVVVGVL